jgi:hypothetical protein
MPIDGGRALDPIAELCITVAGALAAADAIVSTRMVLPVLIRLRLPEICAAASMELETAACLIGLSVKLLLLLTVLVLCARTICSVSVWEPIQHLQARYVVSTGLLHLLIRQAVRLVRAAQLDVTRRGQWEESLVNK